MELTSHLGNIDCLYSVVAACGIIEEVEKERCCLAVVSVMTVTEVNDNEMFDAV